jgi:hypothetical protein
MSEGQRDLLIFTLGLIAMGTFVWIGEKIFKK